MLIPVLRPVLGTVLAPVGERVRRQRGRSLGAAIRALFANNEQGAWYDPSDFERYMAAKGPELVSHPTFDDQGTGWTVSGNPGPEEITFSDGVAWFNTTGSRSLIPDCASELVVGKTYLIEFDVLGSISGVIRFLWGGTVYTFTSTSPGRQSYVLKYTGEGYTLYFQGASGGYTYGLTNVSVRELPQIESASLFQDAAGTTPVTAVEQPVGLMLDKRFGLVRGPERWSNQDFVKANEGVVTTVVAGQRWTVQSSKGASGNFSQGALVPNLLPVLEASKWYEYRIESDRPVNIAVYDAEYVLIASGAAANTIRFMAGSSGMHRLYVTPRDTTVVTFSSPSVRELPGNHASQATTTARPVLSARKNLLIKTEDFTDSAWVQSNMTVLADELRPTANAGYVQQTGIATVGQIVTISIDLKPTGLDNITVYNGAFGADRAGLQIDLSTFGISPYTTGAGQAPTNTSVTNLGDGYTRIRFTITAYAADITLRNSAPSANANGVNGLKIRNFQVETGSTATRYQRVTTATDYDWQGFPHYLRFDGVDDFLSTGSIDFTGTDKMTVWAGVYKASDAATAEIVSLSEDIGNWPGAFSLRAPNGPGADTFTFFSRGATTTRSRTANGCAAPISAVLVGTADIAAQNVGLSIYTKDASLNEGSNTADQGGGSYGNYPMFIGRRGIGAMNFNGNIYGLVIRGAASTGAQIISARRYLANKSGVTL